MSIVYYKNYDNNILFIFMESKDRIRAVLAQNIRKLRKEKGLTQEQLAELADISNTYIANIECGKTWVSDATLEKIASSLEVPIYEFFIQEESAEIETKKNPKSLLNKILLAKEKKLKSEISALIQKAIKEVKEEFEVS